jgi:hypothetical protein
MAVDIPPLSRCSLVSLLFIPALGVWRFLPLQGRDLSASLARLPPLSAPIISIFNVYLFIILRVGIRALSMVTMPSSCSVSARLPPARASCDSLAGYGASDKGEKYWIVQNSWGPSWGMNGTFMIKRGTDECGIEVGVACMRFVEFQAFHGIAASCCLLHPQQLGALDRGCPLAGVPEVSH